MEIIKHGTPQEPEEPKILTFRCTKCGCFFKCGDDEYRWDGKERHNYVAKCPEPFCGNICIEYRTR